MKVYLHIGTPKTGSTAIEEYLYLNRERIARQGFLYPTALTPNLPHILHNHNALAFAPLSKCLPALRQEITRAALPKVILSAENLQCCTVSPEQLKQLRHFLQELGFEEIEIIVYLREPAALCTSLCSQQILDGDTARYEHLSPAECERFRLIADHCATLQRWEAVFGREHLLPRLFAREDFYAGDLIRDFLHCVGIQYQADFQDTKESNPSLNLLQMELLRAMTQLVPGAAYDTHNLKYVLLPYIRHQLNLAAPQLKYAPPRRFIEQWRAAFAEGHAWVLKNYFPDRQQLFNLKPLDDYQENYTLPSMCPAYWEALARTFLVLARNHAQALRELQHLRHAVQTQAADRTLHKTLPGA